MRRAPAPRLGAFAARGGRDARCRDRRSRPLRGGPEERQAGRGSPRRPGRPRPGRARPALGGRSGADRGRDPGLRGPGGRARVQHRPQRGAHRQPDPGRLRGHPRPDVRLRPAGGQLRLRHDRRRPARLPDRRRRGEHEPGPDGLERRRAGRGADQPEAGRQVPDRAPGDLGRIDRREVGARPGRAGRVRGREPREGGAGDRRGALPQGDRPGDAARRLRLRHRRGRAGAGGPRQDGHAGAVVQDGRRGHRRQLQPDLGRRRGTAAHGARRRPRRSGCGRAPGSWPPRSLAWTRPSC